MLSEKPRAVTTDYADRAVYLTPDNGFHTTLPDVPPHVFLAERDRAFDPATGTAFVDLDLSAALKTAYPATTPLLLARYARVEAGRTLSLSARTSGEAWYVIAGRGRVAKGADALAWAEGDVFCLPGSDAATELAADVDSVLLVTTDEPLLAWNGAAVPEHGSATMQAVLYPAAVSRGEFARVIARTPTEKVTGRVVLFTGPGQQATKSVTPTITLALNGLAPGGDQPPHRHNSVALTLALEGEDVYSEIDGRRVDWQRHAVLVTPPRALHSHHNRGDAAMLSLVVQDGGAFYNARAIGFSFE